MNLPDFNGDDTDAVMAAMMKACSNLPPVTITITDPQEVRMLLSSVICFAAKGDQEVGLFLSLQLANMAKTQGIETGVTEWVKLTTQSFRPIPKFMKPLIVFYFTHISENYKKE